jgi:hypothetical protein
MTDFADFAVTPNARHQATGWLQAIAKVAAMQSPVPRALSGLMLVATVVWLGLETAKPHPAPLVVVAFGLASALVAPIAIGVLGGIHQSNRDRALERLAKAGDVEEKVARAETAEQQLQALQRERERLGEIIQYAATRQLLVVRQQMLEDEATRLIQQAQDVSRELAEIQNKRRLLGEELEQTSSQKDLRALEKRLIRGRTGAGRRSTLWLEYAGLPIAPLLPVPLRRIADDLLDGMEDFQTWRLGKRARKQDASPGDGAGDQSAGNEGETSPDA